MDTQSSGNPRSGIEPLFGPFWPALVIAGALFALLFRLLREPSPAPHLALALACLIAGTGIWGIVHLIQKLNRKESTIADWYRLNERHFSYVEYFFADNPEIAQDARVREALLPTDHELELLDFSPSFESTLRRMREGTHWLVSPDRRGGPADPLHIEHLCQKPAGHYEVLLAAFEALRSRSADDAEVS